MTHTPHATLRSASLTFHPVCECGAHLCIDCQSWVTESDVPLHPEGPVVAAVANTAGVDAVRLVSRKYTLITVLAGSFDPFVVLQSIKENVASVGVVDCMSGFPPSPPPLLSMGAGMDMGSDTAPEVDQQLLKMLAACIDDPESVAATANRKPVVELGGTTIWYDKRQFLQLHPKPPGRSRLRAMLLRWLAD